MPKLSAASWDKECSRFRRIGGGALPIGGMFALVVGELVMGELQKLDEVAYIRFASVYRRFQDLNEFREEIDRLAREPSKE